MEVSAHPRYPRGAGLQAGRRSTRHRRHDDQQRDLAADQIAFGFLDKVKAKAKAVGGDFAKKALENARKNYLGFSEVEADGEVAKYILSELANGNVDYLKSLGQVSHQSKPVGRIAAEVDAQIKTELTFEMWEKIKNLFKKKQEGSTNAQSSSEAAIIDRMLNAEVSAYLRAQSDSVFDDLKSKISRAQT